MNMPDAPVRIALAAVAVAVAVFFVLQLNHGTRLEPGTGSLLKRTLVELRAGRDGEAERLARRATQREPRNWEAWRALAVSLQDRDDAEARRAARRARRLNPLAR